MRSEILIRSRRLVQAFGWTAAAQVLSAVSNVIISLAAARAGGVQALGEYQLAFAAGIVVLGFLRQLVTEPFLAAPPEQNDLDLEGKVITASTLYSLPFAMVAVVLGAIISKHYIMALGPALVAICVQDALRYLAFRRKEPRYAVVLDGVWVTGSILAWPIVTKGGATEAVGSWGAGAAVSVIVGMTVLGVIPHPVGEALTWWKRRASAFGGYLAAAGVAYTAGTQAVTFGVAALLGTAALGELRGAMILLGPVVLMQPAIGLVLIPRHSARTSELSERRTRMLTLSVGAAATGACAVVVVTQGLWMELLFDGSVSIRTELLVALSAYVILLSMGTVYVALMRAEQMGREVLWTYSVGYAVGSVAILIVAATGSLVAVGWAHPAQAALALFVGWFLWRSNRPREPVPA